MCADFGDVTQSNGLASSVFDRFNSDTSIVDPLSLELRARREVLLRMRCRDIADLLVGAERCAELDTPSIHCRFAF